MRPRSAIRSWVNSWIGRYLLGDGIPVSPAVARYRSVSKTNPDFLWLGRSLDEVVEEQLTQLGTAVEGGTPTGFHDSPMNDALMSFPDIFNDAWSAVGTAIGNFDGSKSVVVVVVFRLVGSLIGVQSLVAKIAAGAGYELTLNDAAALLCTVNDGTTNTFAVFPRRYDGGEYFVLACKMNKTTGNVEIETTLDSLLTFALPPASPGNLENFHIGRARTTAAPVETGLVSLESGTQVDNIDMNQLVYGVARELFMEPVEDDDGNLVVDADGNEVLTHG